MNASVGRNILVWNDKAFQKRKFKNKMHCSSDASDVEASVRLSILLKTFSVSRLKTFIINIFMVVINSVQYKASVSDPLPH
jgi:hypothetical protein